MSLEKAKSIRIDWERSGAKRLKMSKRPVSDFHNKELAEPATLVANIKKRMEHLGEVLALLHKIYHENEELYGDRFLAFVGNEVVREWPWKDYPFISKSALRLIEDTSEYSDVVGKLPFEIKNKELKETFTKLRYEHWTPISFFRDTFHSHEPLDKEVYYFLLIEFYRIVWITKEEDDRLNKKHRSWRPESTYQDLGIEIKGDEQWENLGE
jgi:hypothetical protein